MLSVEKAAENEKMFRLEVLYCSEATPWLLYISKFFQGNAFIWKINENVWHFHLTWKPHRPQFNCFILCGSGRLLESEKATLVGEAHIYELFSNDSITASDE